MPNANAEAQRRWRQRQKEKKQEELVQAVAPAGVFRKPFFEVFTPDDQVGSQYCQALELTGIAAPLFEDDRGPEAFTLDDLQDHNPFGEDSSTSLGRAEVMIGCLIKAAQGLADEVNAYKRTEIKARLAEVEASDLSDPAKKKAALKEAARLNKMLDQLDKQVRWTFPAWKVTG
ncbi:hypothetical protein [Paracoccus lutimaris]|uniref:Uncharacterized protein n=1 Tax=Paracoccus lutimaris TaxID=1490030 RepID=A0A368YTC1_9RHOB|nr:hypothetical protein [Paracoccus lutimaris]RCW83462.1 hypothetical protein DFP89_110144 [Paracoccus lutimaris]